MKRAELVKRVDEMEEMIACALGFARSYQKYDDDPNQAKRLLDGIIECLEAEVEEITYDKRPDPIEHPYMIVET